MDTQTRYNRVADEYVRRISDELKDKPLDRQLLDRFAESVRNLGIACDMGCGSRHVAPYLHEHEMVARACRLTPAVEFRQGDIMALDVPNETWADIVAFYSVIHIPRMDVVYALRELRRVLRPGGLLLLSFHIGDKTIHLDEWWGHEVCIDFFFFSQQRWKVI
jgi:SAM-dependent methyltransferase